MDAFWNLFFEQVVNLCKELVLSEENLHEIIKRLFHELQQGLGKETNEEATVKCFPTYVRDLPNGKGKNKANYCFIPVHVFHICIQYIYKFQLL